VGVAAVASRFISSGRMFSGEFQDRQRYQTSHTVAMPGDIEDELRHLIAVVPA